MSYGLSQAAQGTMKQYVEDVPLRVNSTLETLVYRKNLLEEQLKTVNDAIEALQANPQIEKILTLLAKVR